MLGNLSFISFLIYAMALGFAAAMIYTNIQRTALSKFINALIDKDCTSYDKALTLEKLGLSGLYISIAKSAAKKQFGIKKSVNMVEPESKSKDKLESMLDSANDGVKYYLKDDCDKELLLKRYNYVTLSAKYIVLFLAALTAIAIAAVFAVNMIITNATKQKTEGSDKPEQETAEELQEQQQQEITDTESEPDSDISEENSEASQDGSSVSTPTLPVS